MQEGRGFSKGAKTKHMCYSAQTEGGGDQVAPASMGLHCGGEGGTARPAPRPQHKTETSCSLVQDGVL